MPRVSIILALSCFLIATKCLNVKGDQALIDETCRKTPQPGFCQLCMREDPDRYSKDTFGLALQSADCSISRSVNVSVDLDVISNGTVDNLVKDVCLRCQFLLGNSIKSLQAAKRHLDEKRMDEAVNAAGRAGDNRQQCAELLVGEFPATDAFNIDFEILKEYYINVVAILSQLL
ncbi:OLC1v1035309C1 [Oldenlandia corymbosa var. corymbosa]|uniref:OLC1v1035309C1 n=1 Tax=Oldenlandia corymbosa var. corymbosa TaxID=529605 RepID=A0AAV1CTE2_OLDCO|nr:OLC1v1035309C1 [Oldenlandia corymbosa var. corymbosa]